MENLVYDLVINGYDWGPANDKIIIHLSSPLSQEAIFIEDFSITTETYRYNWNKKTPELEFKKQKRIIKDAYICDEQGKRSNLENKYIAFEFYVHPDDFATNPFLYGLDMMNHWQEKYEIIIENKKLNIFSNTLNKRICPLADKFSIGENKIDDINLHYALYTPEKQKDKIPLIIWLHGMGEGGNDPYIALLGNKVVNLISDDIQSCFDNTGAYVLVPQVNGFWMQTDIKAKGMDGWISEKSKFTKSYYTKALYNLITTVIENNPKIDKKRIYIGGCSNGGYMTINMLLEYPDYFAAAYPICEAYPDCRIDDHQLEILSKQHIWFTHSKDDKTVNPETFSIATVKRLKNINANDIHFSLWDNVSDKSGSFNDINNKPYVYNGHFSWIYVLNNMCCENGMKIFEWISKISK